MVEPVMRFTALLLMRLCAIALAIMVAVLCWQVFGRYLLNFSPAWTEQSALLLMIWITFLGSAAGVADGFHIRIAEGVLSLPERWSKRAVQTANLFIIIAGLLIAWKGISLVGHVWHNEVPTLPINRGPLLLVIPLSGILMAFFAAVHWVHGNAVSGSRGSA